MPGSEQADTPEREGARPRVSLGVAISLVVANMIGVGVFTSLGFQARDMPSAFAILLLWSVGGVIALCGVVAYAELGAMFPRSSGEYNFLREAYHPAVGFMAGWLSATVGFAAPVALAAMAFGEYARAVAPSVSPLALALGVVWLVSLVQLAGLRLGGAFQLLMTLLKVVLIAAFMVAGLTIAAPQLVSFAPAASDARLVFSGSFAVGLVFVMYSFSGWNAATYIIGEMDSPARNVPRAMLIGTFIVLIVYLALNAVFLLSTPMVELAGQIDVARVAGDRIFGSAGGRVVALIVSAGLVSTISAMMWIGPRVLMTMGEDMTALRVFAGTSASGAPVAAILLQLAVASALLFGGNFEAVLEFVQFGLLVSSFLAVLAVIVLRRARPYALRPYRAWGYPLTPALFLLVTALMIAHMIIERPLQSLASAGMMLSGLVFYTLFQRGNFPGRQKARNHSN